MRGLSAESTADLPQLAASLDGIVEGVGKESTDVHFVKGKFTGDVRLAFQFDGRLLHDRCFGTEYRIDSAVCAVVERTVNGRIFDELSKIGIRSVAGREDKICR